MVLEEESTMELRYVLLCCWLLLLVKSQGLGESEDEDEFEEEEDEGEEGPGLGEDEEEPLLGSPKVPSSPFPDQNPQLLPVPPHHPDSWRPETPQPAAGFLPAAPPPGQLHSPELGVLFTDCERFNQRTMFGGPVCASDGLTYPNELYLCCLNYNKQRKGRDRAEVVMRGPCPHSPGTEHCPWSPVYTPVCGDDRQTYANVEAVTCYNKRNNKNVKVVSRGECVAREPCGAAASAAGCWAAPVCASNARTYPSADAVRCLRQHHSALDIVHDGGCRLEEVAKAVPSRNKQCQRARELFEIDYMCGTDNVTYLNPYFLLCYKPYVQQVSMGQCNSDTHRACLAKKDPELKKPQYQVCGNDGNTYPSSHHLKCKARNNKYLQQVHEGRCRPEDSPCLAKSTVLAGPGQPVCGSDRLTYTSPTALFCVKRNKDHRLKYVHDGPCLAATNHLLPPSHHT